MSAAQKLPPQRNDDLISTLVSKIPGRGPLNKRLAGAGFAAGLALAYGPLAAHLDKLKLDQISVLKMIPVPGGPKVLVVGGLLAVVGYLIGELLETKIKK